MTLEKWQKEKRKEGRRFPFAFVSLPRGNKERDDVYEYERNEKKDYWLKKKETENERDCGKDGRAPLFRNRERTMARQN